MRAEDLLRNNKRILIRGPAGSGKTTLLNYLAWSCSHPDRSSNPWSGGIPFFIPLRTVARTESGPPQVQNFVNYSVDKENWATSLPDDWIEDVLSAQNRAVVMIDGVDELPSNRRPAFWEWLTRFSETYPNTRIVITSRILPGTSKKTKAEATDDWNPPPEFIDAQLDEMSDSDIAKFIEHWHNAVDQSKLDTSDIAELTRAKNDLPKKLSDPVNRRIRELCSTPLLCAMVCVLHWREEGYLPRQRVDLYDRCCEMFIEARDLKRQIMLPAGPASYLTKNDKERVLQKLAFEMMYAKPDSDEETTEAYRIEISREKALKWIEPTIIAFQQSEARNCTPKQVLDYLIERTGLLREPAGGLVDFPHRTFQEYLAACAAGALGREDILANQADNDQWHETIMLAAGTPTGGVKFGHDLVQALIKRAERHRSSRARSQRIRKTCFALALGCIENLRQPDPSLRDHVLGRLAEIVPPADDTDAKILSVAGDAAVPHLEYDKWKDERTNVIAACAQTLRLIGSNLAKKSIMDGYINERKESVVEQICKIDGIDIGDIPLVAEHVQSEGTLPHYFYLRDVASIVRLNGLRVIEFTYPVPNNLDKISELKDLQKVVISGCPMSELRDIVWPEGVEELILTYCSGGDLSWLSKVPLLKTLQIEHHREVLDISSLPLSLRIERIGLAVSHLSGLPSLPLRTTLQELALVHCIADSNWDFLSEMQCLKKLKLYGGPNTGAPAIDNFQHLTNLEIGFMQGLSNISFLSRLESLESLRLVELGALNDISGIEGLNIVNLIIRSCSMITDLKVLSSLSKLELLGISACTSVSSISIPSNLLYLGLQRLNSLRSLSNISQSKVLSELYIGNCRRLKSIDEIRNLDNLQTIELSYLPRIDDFSPISSCQNLVSLSISSCDGLDDLSPICQAANLKELYIGRAVNLSSVSCIGALKELETLLIFGCPDITEINEITTLKKLDKFAIRNIAHEDMIVPEELLIKRPANQRDFWSKKPPMLRLISSPIFRRSFYRSHSNILDFHGESFVFYDNRFDENLVGIM